MPNESCCAKALAKGWGRQVLPGPSPSIVCFLKYWTGQRRTQPATLRLAFSHRHPVLIFQRTSANLLRITVTPAVITHPPKNRIPTVTFDRGFFKQTKTRNSPMNKGEFVGLAPGFNLPSSPTMSFLGSPGSAKYVYVHNNRLARFQAVLSPLMKKAL